MIPARNTVTHPSCERCGGATRLAAQVSPLGNEPGVRIYHCQACTCFTVIEWGGRPESQPHAARTQPVTRPLRNPPSNASR